MKTLATLHCPALTNKGEKLKVTIDIDEKFSVKKPIINIHGTPGMWFFETLSGKGFVPNSIYIDCGQDWRVINLVEIMAEAGAVVEMLENFNLN